MCHTIINITGSGLPYDLQKSIIEELFGAGALDKPAAYTPMNESKAKFAKFALGGLVQRILGPGLAGDSRHILGLHRKVALVAPALHGAEGHGPHPVAEGHGIKRHHGNECAAQVGLLTNIIYNRDGMCIISRISFRKTGSPASRLSQGMASNSAGGRIWRSRARSFWKK